jgi:hypothetical protein
MIDSKMVSNLVEEQLKISIDSAVQTMVQTTIDNLVLDQSWLDKIESLIIQSMSARVSQHISNIDVDALVVKNIDSSIDRWQQRFKENFHTTGIIDEAEESELVISPGSVRVNHGLVSDTASINKDVAVHGTLIVKNLSVSGTINTDNASWNELALTIAEQAASIMTDQWKQELVKQVLDLSRQQGIDFENITLMGMPLVSDNRLADHITETKIQSTGKLRSLTVIGEANLYDTLNVSRKRIGINTDHPDMALSIWDEDVSLSLGKLSDRQAYIGTSRLQNLVIGVNRTGYIEIDTEGLVTIEKLRVGRHLLGHTDKVPAHSSTRGDILFNNDPKPDSPFAWVCLGGFRWQAIKSA